MNTTNDTPAETQKTPYREHFHGVLRDLAGCTGIRVEQRVEWSLDYAQVSYEASKFYFSAEEHLHQGNPSAYYTLGVGRIQRHGDHTDVVPFKVPLRKDPLRVSDVFAAFLRFSRPSTALVSFAQSLLNYTGEEAPRDAVAPSRHALYRLLADGTDLVDKSCLAQPRRLGVPTRPQYSFCLEECGESKDGAEYTIFLRRVEFLRGDTEYDTKEVSHYCTVRCPVGAPLQGVVQQLYRLVCDWAEFPGLGFKPTFEVGVPHSGTSSLKVPEDCAPPSTRPPQGRAGAWVEQYWWNVKQELVRLAAAEEFKLGYVAVSFTAPNQTFWCQRVEQPGAPFCVGVRQRGVRPPAAEFTVAEREPSDTARSLFDYMRALHIMCAHVGVDRVDQLDPEWLEAVTARYQEAFSAEAGGKGVECGDPPREAATPCQVPASEIRRYLADHFNYINDLMSRQLDVTEMKNILRARASLFDFLRHVERDGGRRVFCKSIARYTATELEAAGMALVERLLSEEDCCRSSGKTARGHYCASCTPPTNRCFIGEGIYVGVGVSDLPTAGASCWVPLEEIRQYLSDYFNRVDAVACNSSDLVRKQETTKLHRALWNYMLHLRDRGRKDSYLALLHYSFPEFNAGKMPLVERALEREDTCRNSKVTAWGLRGEHCPAE